ncbi:hypothetical protein KCP76_05250 [Salmonella enterica subsp. enterica serovar Weltevreden]|nr:hypothetical protein KCP76_05250 [Salmonella enterica subsp. enterica serovar Weltevreden]
MWKETGSCGMTRWRALAEFCDYYLFAPRRKTLRARLIGRKLAGGLSQAEAVPFMNAHRRPK